MLRHALLVCLHSKPPHSSCVLTTCSDQWALDFNGNKDRIVESIRIAKSKVTSHDPCPVESR